MTIHQPGARALAARGAVLTLIAQVYRVTLSFVSSVFLARLLTPTDFGLVAMVSSIAAFGAVIQDLGLNQALIQRERISAAQISALFWLSAGFSFVLALAFAAGAPLLAWFFGDSRLIALTIAFAFLFLFSGGQSQQLALLNRELRFKTLAGIDVVAATMSAVVGVALAWLTWSYWALFAASLAYTLAGLVCVWIVCSFRPSRPSFEGDFKEIIRFGSGVSSFNIVNYFARNADNLLIGRFYGSEQLGLYDRAYRLLLFPLQQIQFPLGRVMLPLLSRLQSDPKRYRKAYTECITMLLAATQPGLIFAIIFSEEVFLILFGANWVPAASIFRWLGVAGLYHAMSSPTGWLFLSQGRSGDFFRLGLYNAVTIVGAFVAGLPWGPLGVAAAYAVSEYLLRVPVTFVLAGRRGPVTTRELRATAAPHVVATLVAGLVLFALAQVIPPPGTLACLLLAVLSYGVYCLVLIIFPEKRRILIQTLATLWSLSWLHRPVGTPN